MLMSACVFVHIHIDLDLTEERLDEKQVLILRSRKMSGMLPGVGVSSRRRTQCQHSHHARPSHTTWSHPTATMDEATRRARHRLEERLGHFRRSYRRPSNNIQEANEGRGSINRAPKKDTPLVSKLLRRPWHFQLKCSKSEG